MRLTVPEEFAVFKHILDLDTRRFFPCSIWCETWPTNRRVQRHGERVGKNCPDNSVKCVPEPKTRWIRAYDRQQALNKDIQIIGKLLGFFRARKENYRPLDDDTYNSGETAFMMCVLSPRLIDMGAY